MTQELWVPGPLPSLNDLIGAAKGAGGTGTNYSKLKKQWQFTVWAYAKKARLKRADGPVDVEFVWREKNRRRDLDNISGGGQKLVLDGLVKAGVLEDDGWEHVFSIQHRFHVDPRNPGVLIRISPACPF
jgi:Holliday junction resolvase RusA-like endonuclease